MLFVTGDIVILKGTRAFGNPSKFLVTDHTPHILRIKEVDTGFSWIKSQSHIDNFYELEKPRVPAKTKHPLTGIFK